MLRPLYHQLRTMARARLSGGAGTLSPTALVHEVMLRFLDGTSTFQDEAHFLASASGAMRHVLVDRARRKLAQKRQNLEIGDSGWEALHLPLSPEELLDIHRELERFTQQDIQLGRLVELRVFGGMTFTEIGTILGMAPKTAERRWRFASATLRLRIAG